MGDNRRKALLCKVRIWIRVSVRESKGTTRRENAPPTHPPMLQREILLAQTAVDSVCARSRFTSTPTQRMEREQTCGYARAMPTGTYRRNRCSPSIQAVGRSCLCGAGKGVAGVRASLLRWGDGRLVCLQRERGKGG
jgi:hypothetical protein